MAISNPLILLPVNEDDSLQDLYDEKLFEFRQFFSRQLPTTKLFSAKLKKLKQITEAFVMLGGQENNLESFPQTFQSFEGLDVKTVVSLFQSERNDLRLRMNSSQSYMTIENNAMKMIESYDRYAQCWSLGSIPENHQVKLSEELDAMSLLKEVASFNERGSGSFEELNRLSMDNLLYKEAIRLSLWLKFEENV